MRVAIEEELDHSLYTEIRKDFESTLSKNSKGVQMILDVQAKSRGNGNHRIIPGSISHVDRHVFRQVVKNQARKSHAGSV
jgi:hypothetical protein